MQVVHARWAGLDVHKKTVVACVLLTHPDGTLHREVRTFTTMTAELLALADWLDGQQVTHVALESTGVFWQPVFNLLEDGHTIVLVNPQHVKAVPGRKTDVKDSEWLADLLRHGLLEPSFIPPAPIRELRDLTRYRKSLIGERAGGEPAAEGAGDGEHQAGDGGLQRPRRQRAADAHGIAWRGTGCGGAGGVGTRAAAREAAAAAPRARRPGAARSSHADRSHPCTHPVPGGVDGGVATGDRSLPRSVRGGD